MKLNYRRTILVGFAFFLISVFWQAYDNLIPKILTDKFGLNQFWSGIIMALDNVLAVFMLPVFGSLSDKCSTKRGRRTPFILCGTLAAAILFVGLSVTDNLQLASVSTMLNAQCDGDLPLAHIIAAYDFYESLVERLLDRIIAMMVRLTCENGSMKMNLQIGCVNNIPEQMLEDLCLRFGSFTYTLQDEDVILDLEICEGGACK